MTLRHVIEIDTIFLVTAAAVLSGIFVWNNNRSSLPISFNTSQVTMPLSPISSKVERASQISADGTKNLIMSLTSNTDGTYSYKFVTEDSSGINSKQIFLTTVGAFEKYNLPFNAWSPDNKYLFIYKNDTNALVFRADGEPIAPNEQYIDLESVFKSKNNTNTLKEVTGWADPALVLFNTTDKNGQKASFWLEVPSRAIIPLATQF